MILTTDCTSHKNIAEYSEAIHVHTEIIMISTSLIIKMKWHCHNAENNWLNSGVILTYHSFIHIIKNGCCQHHQNWSLYRGGISIPSRAATLNLVTGRDKEMKTTLPSFHMVSNTLSQPITLHCIKLIINLSVKSKMIFAQSTQALLSSLKVTMLF